MERVKSYEILKFNSTTEFTRAKPRVNSSMQVHM